MTNYNASLIVNNGWKILQNRLFKPSPDYTAPTVFEVGINSTNPTVSSTALDQKVPIQTTTQLDACDATTGWTAATDTAVALYTSSFVEGTGSLSIAKTGTAGTTFGTNKTLGSQSFTSKDLWAFVYITALSDLVTTGTAITIRYGSDSSNYYYKDFAASSLVAAQWNALTFNSSTATGTTGAPAIGSMVYFQIILNVALAANTVAANRILMDDIKLAVTASYIKTYEATYPSFDTTNYIVTVQGRVLSTQCNGFYLTAYSLWNTDATPLLYSTDVFTSELKTSNDEFLFETQDRKVI